jgi:ABC-type transporter Mla subunit MlaD
MNWKAIKGMFVEVDETEESPKTSKNKSAPVTPPPSAPTAPVPAAAIAPAVVPIDPSQGQKDQAIVEGLSKALSDANLSGFDYFEFAQILEKLQATLPSEQLKFQTAFSSAAVMGATKAQLLESTNHYLKVLEDEANKFAGMVAEQLKTTVTDKEDSVSTIESTILEKSEQINKLTQEINELTNTKTTVLNEAAESRIKIQKVQNDFAACLKVFIDKINGDITKINQYIQN